MKTVLALVFVSVFVAHWLISGLSAPDGTGDGAWAQFEFEESTRSTSSDYWRGGGFWLGLSYGASATFGLWSLSILWKQRVFAKSAPTAGVTLSGIIVAGACFLTGCCGSPMLAVYLALLGAWFLPYARPFVFALTLMTLGAGYWWMRRRLGQAKA